MSFEQQLLNLARFNRKMWKIIPLSDRQLAYKQYNQGRTWLFLSTGVKLPLWAKVDIQHVKQPLNS